MVLKKYKQKAAKSKKHLHFPKNKTHKKTHPVLKLPNPSTQIIYGRFYMNGCHYCELMEDEWNIFLKKMNNYNKLSKTHKFINADYEKNEMNNAMTFLKKYIRDGSSINVKSFPTIYKIENGKISYYQDDSNRTCPFLFRWIQNKHSSW
jgi:hypothetical protein